MMQMTEKPKVALTPAQILGKLEHIHAEFLGGKRFVSADVIVQTIALIRALSPDMARQGPARNETLALKRAAVTKNVTAEELLAALEADESDPAYRKFLRATFERLQGQ